MKLILTAYFLLLSISAWSYDVLVVGDSHSCATFGTELVKNFSKPNQKVVLYCAVSSAPVHWIKGQNPTGQKCQTMTTENPQKAFCNGTGQMIALADLLKMYPGYRVVVALGTNSLLSPTADPTYKQFAQEIKSDNRTCFWIGPPHLNPSQSKGYPPGRLAALEKNLDTFYPSLNEAVRDSCSLIDSREFTGSGSQGFSTIDGVHRVASSGAFWSDQVFQKIISLGSIN